MITFSNENYCEYCFERIVHRKSPCPACGSRYNETLYHGVLPVGSILAGRYAVGKVLGKGGFGVTYLCFDIREKKRVAIKEYLPDSLSHRNSGELTVSTYIGEKGEQFKSGAQKFYEEARLVSHFNGNPNIISVHEFFYENNTTYFVMEYLSGTDIKGYLKKHPKMSEAEVMYIAKHTLNALMIVHSTNTIHRDIAPDNIFMCDDGTIKLIDFGAARHVIANESKSLSVILKHGFAPLEQYQSKGKQGPWTDIYALGVTLYFAIKNRMPDDSMSRLDDPTLDMSGISPELARIITKMMAPMIRDRYTDVFSVKRDFDALQLEPSTPRYLLNAEMNYFFCGHCGKKVEGRGTICDECAALIFTFGQNGVNTSTKSGATIPITPAPTPNVITVKNQNHYCSNCGQLMEEEGKVCSTCLQSLQSPVANSTDSDIYTPPSSAVASHNTVQAPKKKKTLLVWLIIIGSIFVSLCIAVPMIVFFGHNHSYKSYVTKEPTYRESGLRYYYCVSCGESRTETIPKLKADFDVAYDAYDNGDYDTAFAIYEILAEEGDYAAQNNLANCYYNGYGVKKDYYTAVYWYQESALQGNEVAQYNLGNCYFYGNGVSQDYYSAVSLYQESADQDYVDAQLMLGYCYEYGYGITQNYYQAFSWYKKSADQGEPTAQYNLGLCYYYGRGVTQNYSTAKTWFQMAANQGNQDAIEFLNENY